MRLRFLILIIPFLALASCRSTSSMAYLHDAVRDTLQQVINSYCSTVHPGDMLDIYVYSQSPESVIAFNEETKKVITSMVAPEVSGRAKVPVFGYEVDAQGVLVFPILGKMVVEGLTFDELEDLIERRLKEEGYVNDPVVSVSYRDFRVAVLGEVKAPQELHLEGERLTVFEALAMCGDITIYGQRDKVLLIRSADSLEVVSIDLTSKDVLDSPYYYLKQNDIVYVEPNKKKKREYTRQAEIVRDVTRGVSIAGSLGVTYGYIVNILRTM